MNIKEESNYVKYFITLKGLVKVPEPKVGDRIYVGGLGAATIVEDDNSNGIIVHLVCEEDDTISWQIVPDEHSDVGLMSVKVIPDEPIKE